MQITRNEKQFKPISIVLESQTEVDALVDVLCLINAITKCSNDGTEFISVMVEQLTGYGSNQNELVYYNEPDDTVEVEAK
jgi:hypothetical protein